MSGFTNYHIFVFTVEYIPVQFSVPFQEEGRKRKITKKKVKEKKTTTPRSSPVLGPKCSLPCINSMALPQGDTSIYCDRDCIELEPGWSLPNRCTVLMRDREGAQVWPGKEICLFLYHLTSVLHSPPSMAIDDRVNCKGFFHLDYPTSHTAQLWHDSTPNQAELINKQQILYLYQVYEQTNHESWSFST